MNANTKKIFLAGLAVAGVYLSYSWYKKRKDTKEVDKAKDNLIGQQPGLSTPGILPGEANPSGSVFAIASDDGKAVTGFPATSYEQVSAEMGLQQTM